VVPLAQTLANSASASVNSTPANEFAAERLTSLILYDQGWTGSGSVGLTASPDPLPSSPGSPRVFIQ
jgi:hypothetical protein